MGKFREPVLVLLFFLVVIAIGVQGLTIIEREHRLSIGKSLNAVINTIDEALVLWSHNHRAKVETIAARHDIVELTQKILNTKDVYEFEQYQKEIRELINPEVIAFGYQGFFIVSLDAINMSSMRDSNIGEYSLIAQQRMDLFERVSSGEVLIVPPILSDVPLKSRDNHMRTLPPTMFAASPIRGTDNSIIAILAIRIDSVNSFSNLMRLGRIGNTGETYTFDKQGVMLTESRFEDQLLSLGLIRNREGSSLNIQLLDPEVDLTTGVKPSKAMELMGFTYSVKKAFERKPGYNIEGYRDYRGVMVLGAWSWNEELDIGIATEIDVSEAMNSFVISRNAIWGSLCLTAFLAAALSLIMVRNRSKAIQSMTQYQHTLESKVAERTESLMKVNSDLQSQIVERVRTEEKLKQVQLDLEGSNLKLQDLASIDGLTEIPNRRTFDAKLSHEWKSAQQEGYPISLLLFDVDDFKRYNDTFGHQAGDACLKSIAKILSLDIDRGRADSMVARYGGEEFVMVLRQTTLDQAIAMGELVKKNLLSAQISFSNSSVEGVQVVTMSIGVATATPTLGQGFEMLLKQADEALYQAKANGRNRVETRS
ncbi:diguanylate cyclase [Vibrio makurazakiensis]|uniref:sensor domain-containing diguanylate cyclase n=1 Tax=Vibrio makurazakiensis TaxID=2910250 RepID=UPI003D0E0063